MMRRQLVVLAAMIVGACAPLTSRSTPATAVAGKSVSDDELAPDDSVPSVEVRTFKGSPYVNVLAWAGDDARYGLRSSIRENGEMSRGFHAVFMGAEVLRQLTIANGGDWSVFPVGSDQGRVFAVASWFRDVHSCEGSHGCTPFEVVTARIEDDLLRRSRETGLEVRVHGRTADVREVITLSPAVVSAYLAKFDSVTTAKRAAVH